MNDLNLSEELVLKFEETKEQLLVRLRQTPATQSQSYGGSMIELYSDSTHFPRKNSRYHGGLYLMASGKFVTKFGLDGYPYPSDVKTFIELYAHCCDIKTFEMWWKGVVAWLNDEHPEMDKHPEIFDYYSQEQRESIVREGIKIMEVALSKELYTELGFGAFTPDQINVNNPPDDKSE